jgi:uncharacterized hydrophobic protein (TIGR00271 family)
MTPDSPQIARLLAGSEPSRSYYILLVLSTLIAAFGLISGSTATVIGAMILAPLMGPIVGVALASIRADTQHFYGALKAEWTGVFLCVTTAGLVGLLVGPESIDYSGAEIVARLRPTMLDLGIGFFAGLAGAYSAWKLPAGEGAAGVAIAVALVPPLAVTGLCVAGASKGEVPWEYVTSSFLLFLANFVTIELASIGVFLLAGMGTGGNLLAKGFRFHLVFMCILLTLTGLFLKQELARLLTENRYRTVVGRELNNQLGFLPGSDLVSFDLVLLRSGVSVLAVVNVDRDISGDTVGRMKRALEKAIPGKVTVDLKLRIVDSQLIGPDGVISQNPITDSSGAGDLEIIADAIRQTSRAIPRFELDNYQILSYNGQRLEVSIVGRGQELELRPIDIRLAERILVYLLKEKGLETTSVGIRLEYSPATIQTSARKPQVVGRKPVDPARISALEQSLEPALLKALSKESLDNNFAGLYLLNLREIHNPLTGDLVKIIQMHLVIAGAEKINSSQITQWESALTDQLRADDAKGIVLLSAGLPDDENPIPLAIEQVKRELNREFLWLCQHVHGEPFGDLKIWTRRGSLGTKPGILTVEAVALTPEKLKREKVAEWKARLDEMLANNKVDYKINFRLRNRIGSYHIVNEWIR